MVMKGSITPWLQPTLQPRRRAGTIPPMPAHKDVVCHFLRYPEHRVVPLQRPSLAKQDVASCGLVRFGFAGLRAELHSPRYPPQVFSLRQATRHIAAGHG
jgi:hypothetical protein